MTKKNRALKPHELTDDQLQEITVEDVASHPVFGGDMQKAVEYVEKFNQNIQDIRLRKSFDNI